MSESHSMLVAANEKQLAGDARWALALRVASSKGFAKAAHLRELLLYLVKRTLTAPGVEITEQEIGCQVLGRRQDYDTQSDNIVRVQIRHLRQKLEEYFATEGGTEPLVLTVPKGSRVPHFEIRSEPEVKTVHSDPAVVVETAPARSLRSRIPRFVQVALPGSVLVLAAFLIGRVSVRQDAANQALANPGSNSPLWSRLFTPAELTTIVIADSSFALLQDTLRSALTLDEYTKGGLRKLIEAEPDERLKTILRDMSTRQHTSLADATISSKLRVIGKQAGGRVTVRYSRHMGVRDFAAGNFIIIGSKRGVPWVELFEQDLNFRLKHIGPDWRFGFANLNPQAGESASYSTMVPPNTPTESYATVAFVPNTARTGDVLLLDGLMMEATEAAGEFCMGGGLNRLLAEKLHFTTSDKLPYFEVLLKIRVVSGAPHNVEVVAWRRPAIL
ncbi:helix-turn-helix domain-containing protein [Paludibaculum fermentans]|uniref:Uncharacterized protein n=1 Tax=Paludibaculum fermentans TaxID=1473598 RepID=A0A7S7SIV3_PALFE|nr:hypothetical protein [Paludibaculum fermentans]QOY87412.1 hypothetical protein IRI77_32410 [Paludibaculum fermentans]